MAHSRISSMSASRKRKAGGGKSKSKSKTYTSRRVDNSIQSLAGQPPHRRTRATYDGSAEQQQDVQDEARRAREAAEAFAIFEESEKQRLIDLEENEKQRLLDLRPILCVQVREGALKRSQA